jgi:O-antigen ligase
LSLLVTTSGVRHVVAGLRRQEVMDVLRGAAFITAVLMAWVSLRPFADLENVGLKDATNGNEVSTYLAFGCMALLTVSLAIRDNMRGVASLLTPGFILFGAWMVTSVVLSLEPATSIRRFSLTACVIVVAATLMLLPKSQDELMRWLSIAALALLAICFLGVVLVPHLSVHLATETQEPQLAGDWRGAFGHKNMAAGMMVMLLFIGVYAMRSGAWLSGSAIVGLASVFLYGTGGKSSLMLSFVVFALTSLTAIVRGISLRLLMLLMPLILLNLLSIGTVMFEGLADVAKMLPLDSSFTGRTDIWTFALDSVQLRLPTGYGFAAFWGTDTIRALPQGMEWTEYASHSHNGYLDTTLAMGLPGLALLIAVLVITPLRNFQAADDGGNNGPLAMLLLRIWLFGVYLSSMESFYFDRSDPLWFTFLLAVFGLHYMARFRIRP